MRHRDLQVRPRMILSMDDTESDKPRGRRRLDHETVRSTEVIFLFLAYLRLVLGIASGRSRERILCGSTSREDDSIHQERATQSRV